MIYLYTLPGNNFGYPDINNVIRATYLKKKKYKYKLVDYVDYLINEIFTNGNSIESNIDIDQIKNDIKDKSKPLLEVNQQFIKYINMFLKKYHMNYDKNGFLYEYPIKNVEDFITASNQIKEFINLFPINNYKEEDIIYINVMYGFQIPMAISLSDRIKKKCRKAKIIWGGNYLTQINQNCSELIKKIDSLDLIIVFNHIKTFENAILYCLNKNDNLVNIIINKNPIKIDRNIIDEPNNYCADYSDIDLSRYFARDRIMPLLLNYGCYYHKCNFCSHFFHYGNYNKIDLDTVLKTLLKEYKKNSFDTIVLVDECILPTTIIRFAKYLIEKNIKTKWMMETRIDKRYDSNTVKILADSGCKLVSFGIESYNKSILKKMNKGIEFPYINKVLKEFKKNDIVVSATFIIGYPGEKRINTDKTLLYILACKYIDLFGLNIFMLTRNSKLCDELDISYNTINLIYRFKGDRKKKLEKKLKRFNKIKKIDKLNKIKKETLNRYDYLYLDKKKFSINYKE